MGTEGDVGETLAQNIVEHAAMVCSFRYQAATKKKHRRDDAIHAELARLRAEKRWYLIQQSSNEPDGNENLMGILSLTIREIDEEINNNNRSLR
jgi:hypothetical protein